jgi:abortive infection bacteriophage resistance protein
MSIPLPARSARSGWTFYLMHMTKLSYSKKALTYQEQLKQLKARGLQVDNEEKAIHLLETVSYYRLSGYWYPLLQDKKSHIFKPSANFETAFQMYCFDRELRKLILSELEKIEVAVRAKMTYILSHKYGSFWFQNPTLFRNPVTHANSLSVMGVEFDRSDEDFIKSFKENYSDPLPPSWILSEIISFGTLSKLYKNLKPIKERKEIAHYFGLPDVVFETWLHSIVYLRNACAHHSRLWNKTMSITPQIPRSPRNCWLTNTTISSNRTYFILSMIKYLLQPINSSNKLKARIKRLLGKYPNIDIKAMNFPLDWEKETLWS